MDENWKLCIKERKIEYKIVKKVQILFEIIHGLKKGSLLQYIYQQDRKKKSGIRRKNDEKKSFISGCGGSNGSIYDRRYGSERICCNR